LTIPNKVIHISIPGVGIKKVIHIPPLWHGGIPLPTTVSPLSPCQNVTKGGTIPSVNQKKFLGKMDPLLNLRGVYIKKNFWEKLGIYV
jgi:hypothetical protein